MERFKSLGWGLRAWDLWYFNDIDQRFGDSWPARHLPARASQWQAGSERLGEAGGPGQIPAQLVGHTLLYFMVKE